MIIRCTLGFRGCLDDVQELLSDLKIRQVIRDERYEGQPLDVAFQGELRSEQKAAAEAMLAQDIGVLSATTAFGKTVLAAWLIAQRGVNTLILVHRRQLLEQYREGKISVGYFNTRAFAMVKADRQTLLDFIKDKVEIRAGFGELLTYCDKKGFQFVIVSNGLDFYIEAILTGMGVGNIEVFAAQTEFYPGGIEVKYIGPEGRELKENFKGAHTTLFLSRRHRLIYVGNGLSDLSPARQARHIFATGDLLDLCRQANLDCIPFIDLNDVVKGLEFLKL